MIRSVWLACGLFVAAPAARAAPLDVERGWAALDAERPLDARDAAMQALREDPNDWRAQRLYTIALEGSGLDVLVAPELIGLSDYSVHAEVVLDWYRIERGRATVDVLGAYSGDQTELASLVLAELSLRDGAPEVTRAMLDDPGSPEQAALAIEAAVVVGADREAAALVREAHKQWPEHPEIAVGLWAVRDASGAVKKARKQAVAAAAALVPESTDPTVVYRARRLLVVAGDKEAAEAAVLRLTYLGERAVPTRVPWNGVMRKSVARAMGLVRHPELPEGRPSEVRDVSLLVAAALRDMGRVDEALEVFEAARARADHPELARAHAEQLLRMRRPDKALEAALDAVEMATAPRSDDYGRIDPLVWRHELAEADLMHATCLLAVDRPDDAMVAAAHSALLSPTAEAYRLLGLIQQTLGFPDAAFTSLSIARALGGQVEESLPALYGGAGDWQEAADAITEAWGAHQGLPETVEVDGIPEGTRRPRSAKPRIDAPIGQWSVLVNGTEITSDALLGQVVVLGFWASWCGPCRVELPLIAELSTRLADEGLPVSFLAVSVDEHQRDYDKFIARQGLDGLQTAWAPELGRRFRVGALPTTWIVDAEGVVRFLHQGFWPGAEEQLEDEIRALVQP